MKTYIEDLLEANIPDARRHVLVYKLVFAVYLVILIAVLVYAHYEVDLSDTKTVIGFITAILGILSGGTILPIKEILNGTRRRENLETIQKQVKDHTNPSDNLLKYYEWLSDILKVLIK